MRQRGCKLVNRVRQSCPPSPRPQTRNQGATCQASSGCHSDTPECLHVLILSEFLMEHECLAAHA